MSFLRGLSFTTDFPSYETVYFNGVAEFRIKDLDKLEFIVNN